MVNSTCADREGRGVTSREFVQARWLRSLGLIAGLLILAAAAAGCASTNSRREVSPGHLVSTNQTPSMSTRLEIVNALYTNTQPRFEATLISNPPPVPISNQQAAQAAILACHEGAGTKTLATALVNTSQGPNPEWAVFLNPPGKHFGIYAGLYPPKHPAILNWYAAFVPVRGSQPIFCTFGGSARLPALPVFRSQNRSHTGSPSANSSPTVTSAVTCWAAYLTAKQGGSDSGAGHQVWVILLTNHSSAPCALDGTPQVTLEGQNRAVMVTHQTDGNFGLPDVSPTASTVVIPSGGDASFVLGFLDNGLTTADCPQAAQLAIALPGGAGTVTAATDLAPCYGDFTVSPIRPSVTAP